MEKSPCQRVCEDALRREGVRFRTPRRKIYVTTKDAKKRRAVANLWVRHRANFWATKVHGYYDCKAFPIPLTEIQRERFRQTLVTGHLRKASEGLDRSFTKPREKHSFVGIPSVTIAAAVAKDRVIMWHVVEGNWNGGAAATMYEKHLKPALKRTWGEHCSRRIPISRSDQYRSNVSRGL